MSFETQDSNIWSMLHICWSRYIVVTIVMNSSLFFYSVRKPISHLSSF